MSNGTITPPRAGRNPVNKPIWIKVLHGIGWAVLLCGAFVQCNSAYAWDMAGAKTLSLLTRDGQTVDIGTIDFTPQGDHTDFDIHMNFAKFKDFFLSMREFKCLDGPEEVQCKVPYPYKHPNTVTPTDLRWLEHSLLFFFKSPTEFGAKLWNGLYYQMRLTPDGIVGTPLLVDLNQISAPPADLATPPYKTEDLIEIAPGARVYSQLLIH